MPTMTLRLDDETHERLTRLAKSTERSKSFLAMQALYEYLEMNEWQVEEVRRTLDAASRAPATDFVEHGRVAEWLDSWGEADEREAPR